MELRRRGFLGSLAALGTGLLTSKVEIKAEETPKRKKVKAPEIFDTAPMGSGCIFESGEGFIPAPGDARFFKKGIDNSRNQ